MNFFESTSTEYSITLQLVRIDGVSEIKHLLGMIWLKHSNLLSNKAESLQLQQLYTFFY